MKHEYDGCGQQVRSNDQLGGTPLAMRERELLSRISKRVSALADHMDSVSAEMQKAADSI